MIDDFWQNVSLRCRKRKIDINCQMRYWCGITRCLLMMYILTQLPLDKMIWNVQFAWGEFIWCHCDPKEQTSEKFHLPNADFPWYLEPKSDHHSVWKCAGTSFKAIIDYNYIFMDQMVLLKMVDKICWDMAYSIVGTHFIEGLWAHEPNLEKFMLLILLEKWYTDLATILRMSWQLSCHDICKIVTWLDH